MPNWKKVIVSGSDASLNSLNVNTYISASTFSGNFTGSLQGSSSYALTSSYALYAAVAPNLGTTTTFTQAASASTWTFTHNLNTLTPQITVYDYGRNVIIPQNIQSTDPNTTVLSFSSIQSGYAVIGTGGGLVITGSTFNFTQASASSTWLIEHPLNTKTPIVQIYDANYNSILTEYISGSSNSLLTVNVGAAQTGYAVLSNGGNLFISGSSARLTQSIAAVTWSFTHSLNTKYPVVQVYDANDSVIVPATITAIDTNTTQITFATPTTGVAVAEFSGINGLQDNTVSSSYAVTASSAIYSFSSSYATTASSADAFIVRNSLTASGLRYPTTDGLENQVLKTDGTNDLAFGDVNTMYEIVYTGENITKSDPLYISGSQGANPIVYKADAANAAKMPVVYIASETIAAGNTTRGIVLGLIEGINLTGYPAGTEVYVAVGGGWTSTRPTGTAIVQVLGIVTKEGNGGKGLVLNPGPVELPNIQSGFTWIGDSNSYPVAVSTSSLLVTTSSYATTASVAPSYTLTSSFLAFTSSVNATTGALNVTTGALNATTGALNATTGALNSRTGSYATTGSNTFIGTQTITGNGTVTGDWTVQGNLTAQTFIISSSVSYFTESFSSGSTKFGDDTGDTHQFTGSVKITGSFEVTGSVTANYGFTGSLFGTSSWAQNAVGAPYYVLTSSFSTTSASISSRVTNLESTASAFVVASASFSSSIVTLTNASASLAINSGSNSTRFTVLENASASFALQSGSNSTRFTILELASGSLSASVATLINMSASYAIASGSDSARITRLEGTASTLTTASASFATVSASYSNLSGSFRSGSFTGSFIGTLFGTASQALTASSVNPLTQIVSINGGLNVTGSTNLSGSAGTTILSANVDTIVFSGSFTSTGSVSITGSVKVSGGITGSLLGTSSYAVQGLSSSFALTASYVASIANLSTTQIATGSVTASVSGSDATFRVVSGSNTFLYVSSSGLTTVSGTFAVTVNNVNEFLISSTGSSLGNALTDTHNVTGSFNITGSLIVRGNTTSSLTASQAISSSYALTASYALNGGSGGGGTNAYTHTQAASSSTWNVNHALNSRNINITVYDFGYNVIIPQNITNIDANNSVITFSSPQSGVAVFNPGGLFVTGSTSVLSQSSAAVTWSFNHNLNSRLINIDVYGSDYSQVIPARVTLMSPSSSQITFATATSGYAVATVNGFSGSVTSAQNTVVQTDGTNATRYITFTDTLSGLGPVYADAGISYNPSTNALTVGTLTETSTIELKQNIKDFVTPLAKFMALQPVSYKWKENKRKDIGFIAEHVQELFPEIVAEDGKSMSYTKLTPILIDIVQRQQETIEEMRKELKAIKRHIDKH